MTEEQRAAEYNYLMDAMRASAGESLRDAAWKLPVSGDRRVNRARALLVMQLPTDTPESRWARLFEAARLLRLARR